MTTPGQRRTANARAKRTHAKHTWWIAELNMHGYSVIQAGQITLSHLGHDDRDDLYAECQGCGAEVGTWDCTADSRVPLPRVLHAVNNHTCTETAGGEP